MRILRSRLTSIFPTLLALAIALAVPSAASAATTQGLARACKKPRQAWFYKQSSNVIVWVRGKTRGHRIFSGCAFSVGKTFRIIDEGACNRTSPTHCDFFVYWIRLGPSSVLYSYHEQTECEASQDAERVSLVTGKRREAENFPGRIVDPVGC